ncbi:MAG: carbamoyltransferase C-terminal domain-containing protein, partial [candidate division Zixibacteria bacterium]|nr:carbamoyltransferase C-terminal domain-containing protein [candidate division Zixibacteria bacterium]
KKVVGWLSGRMEFGPRALGARSILADPRSTDMLATLNLKIKFRESFRPLAPAVLAEDAGQYFELDTPSPYMLLTAPVRTERRLPSAEGKDSSDGIERIYQTRSDIPAVTHLDYSARIQTVDGRDNPRFHALIAKFKELTGCAVLVNTSFNVRGEPIVCSPQEAYRCFMKTGMDTLVLENLILEKTEQPAWADDEVGY